MSISSRQAISTGLRTSFFFISSTFASILFRIFSCLNLVVGRWDIFIIFPFPIRYCSFDHFCKGWERQKFYILHFTSHVWRLTFIIPIDRGTFQWAMHVHRPYNYPTFCILICNFNFWYLIFNIPPPIAPCLFLLYALRTLLFALHHCDFLTSGLRQKTVHPTRKQPQSSVVFAKPVWIPINLADRTFLYPTYCFRCSDWCAFAENNISCGSCPLFSFSSAGDTSSSVQSGFPPQPDRSTKIHRALSANGRTDL